MTGSSLTRWGIGVSRTHRARIERCCLVVRLDCGCAYGQELSLVVAVGKESVAVLEQCHVPTVFLPLKAWTPVVWVADIAGINANFPIAIHFAWLDHG